MPNLPCAACQAAIDYRNVSNSTIAFPYTISLNGASSILNPGEGERQRFCYRVETIGVNGTGFLPLNSWILGVPSALTIDDIYSLSVTLNGMNQNIVWGENAALVSNCIGGCAGLRLSFPMTAATDILNVCLTLNRVFGVGPVPVCLFGNGERASGLSICGPAFSLLDTCPTTAQQEVDVCIPVTITPFASLGEAQITCCGDPVITDGTAACPGVRGGSCSFTVSQRLCVSVPVQFGATTSGGEYGVNCGAAGEGTCENCGNGAASAANFQNVRNVSGASCNSIAAGSSRSSGCRCRNQSGFTSQTQISDVLRWIDK